jgi:hypothetical protein
MTTYTITIGSGVTIGSGFDINTGAAISANLVFYLDALSYSGSGNTWPAVVGNSATLYNGPSWSNTGPGYFNFTPADLQFAESPALGDIPDWTVECWFSTTANLTTQDNPALVTTIYNDNAGNLYSEINFTLSAFGTSNPGLNAGYYNSTWTNTASFTPTVGDWYQMVGTFDGTTLSSYINGGLFSQVAGAGAASDNNGPLRIARRWDGDGEAIYFMPAEISVIKIYNTALDTTQINQNFNALRSRFGI